MQKYQVTDPKGILIDGKKFAKGKILPAGATSSQIRAFLRFKQVKEVEDPKEPEPPTLEEVKASLTENGVQFAPNTGEKKLRELFDKLGTDPS